MSVRKDKVQLLLEINGKQAGGSLKELQNTAKALKLQLLETTDPKKAEEYAASLRKVNGRMKDIWDRTRSVKKETSLWASSLKAISFAALAAGTISWLKSLSQTGDQIETLRGKTDTVFGEAAFIVEASAERQAIALGLTRQEYAKSATAAGDLLIPMGFQRQEAAGLSTDLVNLSGALSVWSSGEKSATEVSEILTKALLGEREQLKTLGISIQEADVKARLLEKGQSKLTGTTLQQAKAVATLELINEKSSDAQDKFNNGTKTGIQRKAELSAKLRQVSQDLAEKLIPVFNAGLVVIERVATGVVFLVNSLAAMPKFLYDNRVAIGLVITGLILFNSQMILASANSLRLAAVEKGRAIATAAVTTAQTLLNAVMTANPIGLVIKAVGLLVIGFGILYSKSQKVRAGVAGLGAVANEVFSIIKESVQAFIDGWNKLKDGDIRGALSSFGTGISKALPINMIRNEGARLGKAFSDGFNDKIKSEADKEIQDLLDKENKLNTPASGSSSPISGGATGDTSTSTGTAAPTEVKAAEVVAEKTRTTYRKLYEDIATMAAARAEQRVSDIETQGDLELEALERNFLLGLATEEEHNALMLEQKLENGETELAVLRELGLAETDIYREKELEKLRTQKEIDDQAIEQAKRTADLKMMLQQEGLSAFRNVVDSSIGLLAKDEAARKKNAGIIKAFETAKILVNAKVEISEIFKTKSALPFGTLIAAAQAVAVGIRAASAISAIKSQSFYTGGRVLPSYSGQRISGPSNIPTQRGGDSVLATLMPGEVVLNPEQQMRAGGAGFFRSIGVPGFDTGGMVLTRADTTPISRIGGVGGAGSSAGDNQVLGDLSQMIGHLASVLQNPISAEVGYGNIEKVASDIQRTRKRAGL